MQVYAELENAPTLQEFVKLVFHGSQDYWLGGKMASKRTGLPQMLRSRRAQAWYMNLSTFDADERKAKFQQNAVHLVVLDDIGTKYQANDLQPTYVIESSEGNFQWGYVFAEPVTLGEANGLFRRLREAKIGDAGAFKTNQLVRLPCGIHGKEGSDYPVALRQWHPERLFTVEELAEAWNLGEIEPEAQADLGEPGIAAGHPLIDVLGKRVINVDDDRIDFTCPQLGETGHTHDTGERQTSAFIRADNSWYVVCLHDSCQAVDFEAWIRQLAEEQGITLDGALPPMPAGAMTMADVTGIAPREPGHPLDHIVTLTEKGYFDLHRMERLPSREVFSALYGHLHLRLGENRVTPAVYLQNQRSKLIARGLTWIPVKHWQPIVACDGHNYVNTYEVVEVPPGEPALIEPWLRVVQHICGEHTDLVLDHMAFTVQRPTVKIRWQILVHGHAKRTGKTLVFKPLIRAMGANGGVISAEEMEAGWGDMYARRKAVLVEEVFDYDARMFNKLKVRLANDGIEQLNIKGQPPLRQPNLYSMYLLTNHDDALQMDADEDKLLVIDAPDERLSPAEYDACGEVEELGPAVYHWLMARDITGFEHQRLPVRTEAAVNMSRAAAPGYAQVIEEMIEAGAPPFDRRAFALDELVNTMVALQHGGHRKGYARALKAHGWDSYKGQKKVKGKVLVRRFWARKADADGLGAADLYDLAEG